VRPKNYEEEQKIKDSKKARISIKQALHSLTSLSVVFGPHHSVVFGPKIEEFLARQREMNERSPQMRRSRRSRRARRRASRSSRQFYLKAKARIWPCLTYFGLIIL